MNDTEIELKLRLPNLNSGLHVIAAASQLALLHADFKTEHLESWYFDTPSRSLQQAGVAYRLRMEEGQWIATIKAGGSSEGGLHRRQEWNAQAAGPNPSLECFTDSTAKELIEQLLNGEELHPLFSTVFDRQLSCLTTETGDVIELAVDTGWIIAGEGKEVISEVELELKQGDAASVLAVGAKLARKVPLFIEERSKYSRGLALAGLTPYLPPPPPKPPVIPLRDPADKALRALLIYEVLQTFYSLEQVSDNRKSNISEQLGKLCRLLTAAEPIIQATAVSSWIAELTSLMQQSQPELQNGRATPILLAIWSEASRKNGRCFRQIGSTWEEFLASLDPNIAGILL